MRDNIENELNSQHVYDLLDLINKTNNITI